MNEEQIDNSLIPDHQRINNYVEFEAYTVGELYSKKSDAGVILVNNGPRPSLQKIGVINNNILYR